MVELFWEVSGSSAAIAKLYECDVLGEIQMGKLTGNLRADSFSCFSVLFAQVLPRLAENGRACLQTKQRFCGGLRKATLSEACSGNRQETQRPESNRSLSDFTAIRFRSCFSELGFFSEF